MRQGFDVSEGMVASARVCSIVTRSMDRAATVRVGPRVNAGWTTARLHRCLYCKRAKSGCIRPAFGQTGD